MHRVSFALVSCHLSLLIIDYMYLRQMPVGQYLCADFDSCLYAQYKEGIDWGHYNEGSSDCSACQVVCDKDELCDAVECGFGTCSWWAPNTCVPASGYTTKMHPGFVYGTCQKEKPLPAVRGIGLERIVGDVPFSPEIEHEGNYYPVCGEGGFVDDNEGAGALCALAGFSDGGSVRMANTIFEKDAMPIGRCRPGEDVRNCTGSGVDVFGNFASFQRGCSAGQPVGVEVVCYQQCQNRHMRGYVCDGYLGSGVKLYQSPTFSPLAMDEILLPDIKPILEKVMTADCLSNVLSLICRSAFKECKEVTTEPSGHKIWVPSLLCLSECESHIQIWEQCMSDISTNKEAKEKVDEAMKDIVLRSNAFFGMFMLNFLDTDTDASFFHPLGCDAKADPGKDTNWILFGGSLPTNISREAPLYPAASSSYTDWEGREHSVPCTSNGTAAEPMTFSCSGGFVNSGDFRICIKTCPVNAYSDREYFMMWSASATVSCIGLFLNVFMAATWAIADSKFYAGIKFQIRFCVYAGILYGAVSTIPMMALKFDLACECDTEDCAGTSTLCMVNRSSDYILLGIVMNLCALTHRLYSSLDRSNNLKETSPIADKLCVAVPALILILAYIFDGAENMTSEAENGVLNVARTAFSCSMRFSNMTVEWLLLWAHYVWSGGGIVVYCTLTLIKIQKITSSLMDPTNPQGTRSNSLGVVIKGQKRRLFRVAFLTGVSMLTSIVISIWTSTILDEWSRSRDLWLDCENEVSSRRDWATYDLLEGEKVCTAEMSYVEDEDNCTSSCYVSRNNGTGVNASLGELFLACDSEKKVESQKNKMFYGLTDYQALCDCSCDDLVKLKYKLKQPNAAIMALSNVARSLVVVIVGLNMGMR
jgi:hypothetical protein